MKEDRNSPSEGGSVTGEGASGSEQVPPMDENPFLDSRAGPSSGLFKPSAGGLSRMDVDDETGKQDGADPVKDDLIDYDDCDDVFLPIDVEAEESEKDSKGKKVQRRWGGKRDIVDAALESPTPKRRREPAGAAVKVGVQQHTDKGGSGSNGRRLRRGNAKSSR